MPRTRKKQEEGWIYVTALFALVMAGAWPARAGVLEDVRNQFNKDKGVPRLVVLVSPT